jgi:coiled-coil and C2 domain-containing protein 2A
VPAKEKVAEALEPRFLEEEGFYVGVKPEIPDRNRNKMENRLYKQPDKVGMLPIPLLVYRKKNI